MCWCLSWVLSPMNLKLLEDLVSMYLRYHKVELPGLYSKLLVNTLADWLSKETILARLQFSNSREETKKKFRLRKDSSSCLLDTIFGTTTAELYQLAKCWEQGKSVKVVSLIDFHLHVKITLFHYKWLLVVNISRIFSFSYKSKLDIFSNFCKIMDMNGLK